MLTRAFRVRSDNAVSVAGAGKGKDPRMFLTHAAGPRSWLWAGTRRFMMKAMSTPPPQWKYLVRKPKSAYKQLFVKDRWVAARTIYGQSVGEDARTPEELAEDFDLPLEAVLEAIAYCESDPPEIREDWEREEAFMEAMGMNDPNYKHHA